MPTTRQDEAPAGTTPPRPGNIRDAIVTAAYRTAHLTAPTALALLLAAVLVAGGCA